MAAITVKRVVFAVLCLLLPLALLALPRSRQLPQPQPAPTASMLPSVTRPLPGSRNPWTLAEARAALARQPDDGYLQFVVLQLARQEGRLAEVRDDIPLFAARHATHPVDSFGLFTNTRAIQQRLQFATMIGAPAAATGPSQPATTLAALQAPAVAERPWRQLLAGKKSAVSPLSRCVPADFYLAEFRALDRLAAALDARQSWFSVLRVQAAQDATDRPVRRRLEQQLVFDVEDKGLAPLVERIAVAGSDPFLGEGSDVTLLIQLRPAAAGAFGDRTERALATAAAQPGAGRSTDKYLGIEYTQVASADRRISAYAVTLPSRRLHIRSNSRARCAGFSTRFVASPCRSAIRTNSATSARRCRRVRTRKTAWSICRKRSCNAWSAPPCKSPRRHGSSATIICASITSAAQLYRTQFGKAPASLDELTRTGCAPGKFNEGSLASPFGGTYALGPDGITGVCSVLGAADNLTPCIDLLVSSATAAEADRYRGFAKRVGTMTRLWLAPWRCVCKPPHARCERRLWCWRRRTIPGDPR